MRTGSRPAAGAALLSGTASFDMGDGLPPMEGLPFTVALTRTTGQRTVGLVTRLASLPDATLSAGSLTIR